MASQLSARLICSWVMGITRMPMSCRAAVRAASLRAAASPLWTEAPWHSSAMGDCASLLSK